MNQYLMLSILAGLAAIVAVSALLLTRYFVLRKHMKNLRTPGFVPPPPTVAGLRWQLRLTKMLSWLFVGKVKVVGLEKLANMPPGSSYQITPNHSHFADIFVVPMIVNAFKPRYMAASAVMGGFAGLLGLIIAPMGAFAASFKAAVKILCSGECMVIFPEGWTYLDGNMGTFHNGAVHCCRQAAAALKKPSYLLPMCIRYGRYPGAWIMKLPIRLQYAILLIGFILFRSGATVVIGDPIADSSLPSDDTEASEFLRQKILNLRP